MKLFTFHTTLLYLPCNSCKIRYFNTPTFSENLDMKVDLFGKHQTAISSSELLLRVRGEGGGQNDLE